MQLNNYLEYLEKTVMAYSDKVKRHLVKQFIQHGIATKQTDTSGQLYIEGLETVDISEKTLSERDYEEKSVNMIFYDKNER